MSSPKKSITLTRSNNFEQLKIHRCVRRENFSISSWQFPISFKDLESLSLQREVTVVYVILLKYEKKLCSCSWIWVRNKHKHSNNTQPNGVGGPRKKIMSCVCFHDIRTKLSRWEVHKINKYHFENQFQLYGSLNNSDSIFSLFCSDWSRTTTKRLNIYPSKVSLNIRFNYNFIFLLFCRGCLNSY